MNKGLFIPVPRYGTWVLTSILITVSKTGDAGVAVHLSPVFTGLSASLLTVFFFMERQALNSPAIILQTVASQLKNEPKPIAIYQSGGLL